MTHTHSKRFNKHTRSLTLVFSLGMLAGILIWAKLRLVTDIPRSAYAEPREVHPPEDQPGEHDAEQVKDESSEPDLQDPRDPISDKSAPAHP